MPWKSRIQIKTKDFLSKISKKLKIKKIEPWDSEFNPPWKERAPDKVTPKKCLTCGRCCQIYKSTHIGGSFPEEFVEFETHCDKWMDKFIAAGIMTSNNLGELEVSQKIKDLGIEPLHNPKKPSEPALHKWVDRGLCQFCHPHTGCILPRKERPDICNRFMC